VRPSVLRPTLLAAAVLALLAVVALASRSDRAGRPADSGDRTLPLAFWDYLVTFGLLAMIAVLAIAVYLRVPLQRPGGRGFSLTQMLGVIVIVAGFVALAGSRMNWPEITNPAGIEDVFVDAPDERRTQQPADGSDRDSRPVRFRWEVFVVVGGLLLVGGGIYAAHWRRQRRRSGVKADAASALSAALDESLDDLRAERDARRAVIAAYARMESTLGRHGLPRRPFEAPLEYLARVLHELRVRSGAVLALTELFERAKFSRHEIDAEMKDEAIGALIAVQNDLKAAS
jgi:uncharacterized membrane protein HdeD (DUF308 family)